jgi:anaerobic magnesium-protoporphyrin IX monomethyl ester cyclase
MNILLIYSTDNIDPAGKLLNHPGRMYFGYSYISAVLKSRNHNVRLLVLSRMLRNKNYRMLEEYISEFQPGLIGFTSVASEYPFILDIAGYIKEHHPDIYCVIGGVHATLNPDEVIKDEFDAVCIGEGEEAFLDLANAIQYNRDKWSIKNFWFKNGTEIIKNPTRAYINDLDKLPFADRDIWQNWIEDGNDPQYMVLLGRGCPFQCTYCSNHALKRVSKGKYVRFRSPDNIIEEINEIQNNNPRVRRFYFEIDTILVKKDWVYELCDKLEIYNNNNNNPISFGTNLRIIPNYDVKKTLDSLKKAGCSSINIGLESGSERVRREILKRKYSNQDFLDTVNYAKSIGLEVYVYNMIGLPTETPAEFQETIEINRIAQPTMTRTSIFFPYKGTQLYLYCLENNIFDGTTKNIVERTDSILDMPQFTRKEIVDGFIWFDYNVYKGKRNSTKYIVQAIIKIIISKPYFIHLNRLLTSKFIRKFIRKFLS